MTPGKQRLVRAPSLRQRIRQAFPGRWIVRVELHDLVKGLYRLVEALEALQRGAQREKVFGPRRLTDRAGEPVYGMIVVAGFDRQQPHQKKAVSVNGVERQRVLAAGLRVPQ